MRALARFLPLLVSLAVVATTRVSEAREVEVLRGRRVLTGLSGTGAGGSIDRLQLQVDLRVQNLAYDKVVGIRLTLDEGKTWQETLGYWVETFEDGSEHWRVDVDGGTVGRWVVVGGGRGDLGPAWARFTAFYRVNGQTHVDDAGGRGHAIAVLAPSAEPLPQARRAPRTVTIGGTLYVVGGSSSEAYGFTVPDVQRLDPSSGTWSKVADLPSIPASAQPGPPVSPSLLVGYEAVAASGRIHLLGGTLVKVGGWPLGHLALDPSTGTWTQKAFLPGPILDRRAVLLGDELHLVPTSKGGAAYVYSVSKDAWTSVPVAGLDLLGGSGYATAALGGKLYLFGGTAPGPGGLRPQNDALVYDAATRSLRRLPAAGFPIAPGVKAVALGTQIVLADSNPDPARGTSAVLVYDPAAGGFQSLAAGPFLGAEASLAAAPPSVVGTSGGPARTIAPLLVFSGKSRVDSWDPVANLLARGVSRTVLRVRADVGLGHNVAIRGSASPLSWNRGAAARWTDGNTWVYETTELLDESFRWKPLVDDARWLPGADVLTRPGETVTLDARF